MDRSIEGGILLAFTTRQNVQSGQSPVGGCLPIKLNLLKCNSQKTKIKSLPYALHNFCIDRFFKNNLK